MLQTMMSAALDSQNQASATTTTGRSLEARVGRPTPPRANLERRAEAVLSFRSSSDKAMWAHFISGLARYAV